MRSPRAWPFPRLSRSPSTIFARPFLLPPLHCQIRRQHTGSEHKWYFNPQPGTTSSPIPTQTPPFAPPSLPPASTFVPSHSNLPSRLRRLVRSTSYFIFFLPLGFLAASGFTTWTWLNTSFTPGTESDDVYMELINERFADEPLMQMLESDPAWQQMTGLSPDGLDTCLRGSRGVQTRYWINPSQASMITMVHFGEGTEGWPQVVHGGMLSSYVANAMDCFASSCFPPPLDLRSLPDDEAAKAWQDTLESGYYKCDKFEISFERPVASGDVYCIWISPAFAFGEDLLVEQEKQDAEANGTGQSPRGRMPKISREDMGRSMIGSVLQIDFFPYEEGGDRRFVRYANAVGTFEKVQLPEVKRPVQFTMDGKLI